ncbi:hypothetical protein FJZ39_02430 [Candidatus Saccharibacteria bacterium]|nr:hypothetical protein [Candidatus Saccharibacteria bacterium]
MLDDLQVLAQRDPSGALEVAAAQYKQTQFNAEIGCADHDGRQIYHIVLAGMGGSALQSLLALSWLKNDFLVPVEIVRDYDLPHYVGHHTLVIAASYSGNTAETVACYTAARQAGAQVAVIAAGGLLLEAAKKDDVAHIALLGGMQPRMAVIASLRALVRLLVHFSIIAQSRFDEIAQAGSWLEHETSAWLKTCGVHENVAKQLALESIGKTPVFYGGPLTAALAYKWKISWNETAKNVAFANQYPEYNHNEFMGWGSHPIEKPFAIFDLQSSCERPEIDARFEISNRLLSGKRPHQTAIELEGDTLLRQLLYGCILADFSSIYAGILNRVDPTPVPLIEKLKTELAARGL